MKISSVARDVETSGLESQSSFTIKASPKAFAILSSGLYSDKIKAIIRELACNALDSHKAAKQDKPFDIHLPGSWSSEFKIRDYGTGLSKESILKLYTTYFESTKQDSNDYIGAYRDWETDRKSTRLNSSHSAKSRMPSSA